jgi:hypothetical protein
MTRKLMWSAEAIKAYESGQGVKLVNVPHPHYEPLPADLNPESLETVEIELPETPRQWVGLTDEELPPLVGDNGKYMDLQQVKRFYKYIEAKLKEKNNA